MSFTTLVFLWLPFRLSLRNIMVRRRADKERGRDGAFCSLCLTMHSCLHPSAASTHGRQRGGGEEEGVKRPDRYWHNDEMLKHAARDSIIRKVMPLRDYMKKMREGKTRSTVRNLECNRRRNFWSLISTCRYYVCISCPEALNSLSMSNATVPT